MRALWDRADAIVAACAALAAAFRRGGTLFVAGAGQAVADAQHVAVEFVHPVLVGKPALPAVSLSNDPGLPSGLDGGLASALAEQLSLLARPGDAFLAITAGAPDPALAAALAAARRSGLLTLLVAAEAGDAVADHVVATGRADGRLAKEADVTAYHLLWELTHVALEHDDLVGAPRQAQACDGPACVTCSDEATRATVVRLLDEQLALVDAGAGAGEQEVSIALVQASLGDTVLIHAGEAIALLDAPGSTAPGTGDAGGALDALYPFLAAAPAEAWDLSADLLRSTQEKIAESAALRAQCVRSFAQPLADCAAAIAERVARGGRLLTFGNGGSSTDAQALAGLCARPGGGWRPMAALALTADVATITALANDVGFDVVFSRQLASLARADDVAVALSTSGNSDNVLRGLVEAKRRGLLTVGLAGNGGGQMATAHDDGVLDHLFVVPSASVHRIQEAQTTLYGLLWQEVQRALGVDATDAEEASRT